MGRTRRKRGGACASNVEVTQNAIISVFERLTDIKQVIKIILSVRMNFLQKVEKYSF